MLLIQLGINNIRDVWKFCQIYYPYLVTYPNTDEKN